MDIFGSTPFIAAITFVVGIVAGAFGYRIVGRGSRDVERLQQQLSELKGDLESYKKSVTRHFNTSSELVNELTHDYVKVYQHLASGARTLADPAEVVDLLEENQSKILISFTDSAPDQAAS